MALTRKKRHTELSEDSSVSMINPQKRRRDCIVSDSNFSFPVYNYHDDSDFDEAFKNLLCPLELVAKSNHYDYNLLKELDSYLTYLKGLKNEEYINFIEAALMLQNVMLIYQKRVDLVVDSMMKLVGKFRAYRVHQNNNKDNDDIDVENIEGNKKRRHEKRTKYYASFEPIKEQVFGTLRNYDCKIINLEKLPRVPKLVANNNIKVKNQLNEILPYILVNHSENIGKKYNYLLNNHLSCDLVANFEYDIRSIGETENIMLSNPLSMDQMDLDLIVPHESFSPECTGPIVFDETNHEVFVPHAMTSSNRENIMNVSQIPENNIDAWGTVNDSSSDHYSDKPLKEKKKSKELENSKGVWLPTYVVSELFMEMYKLKTGLGVDPAFRKLVIEAQNQQKSNISKKRIQHNRDSDHHLQIENNNEEMDENLLNGGGFGGFDDVCYHEEPDIESLGVVDNFVTYQSTVEEIRKYEKSQIDTMDKQLEMYNRVQEWHEYLRPILENEEKQTPFNVHDYGTDILNCFNGEGEKKSFEQLVSGLKQEEVARYFLSTLMLANTNNVRITKLTHNPLQIGSIDIELMNKKRHHEELENSVLNKNGC